jgi:hypothetical protein
MIWLRLLLCTNVRVAGRIDVIDHRREGGRLAGARRAGDEHHALVQVAKLMQDRRQAEAVEARHDARDIAEGGADARRLVKHVDAEPAAVAADVREVDVVLLPESLALRLAQDFVDVALELGVAQVTKLDRHEVAVQPQHRRNADG